VDIHPTKCNLTMGCSRLCSAALRKAAEPGRSRRSAARTRELLDNSNGLPKPLRGSNNPLERTTCGPKGAPGYPPRRRGTANAARSPSPSSRGCRSIPPLGPGDQPIYGDIWIQQRLWPTCIRWNSLRRIDGTRWTDSLHTCRSASVPGMGVASVQARPS